MVLAASEMGEPAEYERIVKGSARTPTSDQRTMYINGAPVPLSMDEFTCDQCSTAIKPGDAACAESIWLDGRAAPSSWEHEFLTVAPIQIAPSERSEAQP